MAELRINDVSIHYEITGSGHPLILLHSYPAHAGVWAPQVPALSPERRVITYDIRGFGKSEAPRSASAYSQEQSIADLLGLMEHLKIAKADLCGFSMGGNIALNFALAHPSRVSKLILIGTGAGTGDGSAFAKVCNAWADAADKGGIEGFARDITANALFTEYGDRGTRERDAMWRLITANTAHGVAHTAREVLAKRPTIDALAPRLKGLTVPTMVIAGAADAGCVSAGKIMSEMIPGARLHVIPATGHFTNLEEPETVNRLILDFLAN